MLPKRKITTKITAITPILMHGADPNTNVEMRAPSLKGLWRFWWRLLNLGEFSSWDKMYKEETKIFGGQDHAAPFRMKVKELQSPSRQQCLIWMKKRNFLQQAYVHPSKWKVEIEGQISENAEDAWKLFMFAGGIGRGWKRGLEGGFKGEIEGRVISEKEIDQLLNSYKPPLAMMRIKTDSFLDENIRTRCPGEVAQGQPPPQWFELIKSFRHWKYKLGKRLKKCEMALVFKEPNEAILTIYPRISRNHRSPSFSDPLKDYYDVKEMWEEIKKKGEIEWKWPDHA